MGDASVASNPNMNMPNPETDMNMGGEPDMNMPSPETDMSMGGEPDMNMPNPETDMNFGGEPNPDRQKKEIQKNIGKACDDFRNYQGQDKEELTKWVEGMLDSILDDADVSGIDDENNSENIDNEPEPQVESVIFTKGQLDKINEMIGIENEEEKEQPIEKKKTSNNNTPFDNPKLNK